MGVLLKKYWSVFGSIAFQVISEFFARIQVEFLQKVFYISSILLLWLGIYKVVFNKKKSPIQHLEKTNNLVYFVEDPEAKGRAVLGVLYSFQKGGKKMGDYFSKMTKKNIVSLVVMVIAFLLGAAIVIFPELAFLEEYAVYIGGSFIGAAFTGALSLGKDVGTAVSSVLPKEQVKKINAQIKEKKKKLDEISRKFSDVIEAKRNIEEFGGNLTAEENVRYNTYITQKSAIEKAIKSLVDELTKS